MKKPRGPLYDAGVIALIAGVLVLGGFSLSVIFRGQPSFPIRVFGSVEEGEELASTLGIRPETVAGVRQGSLGEAVVSEFVPEVERVAGADSVLAMLSEKSEQRLLARARAWAGEEDWARALEAYGRLLRAAPENRWLALEHARVLAWAGDPLAAANALTDLSRTRPNDGALRAEAAQYFWWAGRAVEADSLLSAARERGERGSEVLALQQEIRRSIRPDRPVARRWLREHSGGQEHLAMARAYVDEEAYAPAVRHYWEALATGEMPDSVYLELAGAAAAADSTVVVVRALRSYLRSHPDDRNARVTLARAYGWSDQVRAAARVYRDLLAEKDDPLLRFELGRLYAWNGQETEAARELRRVAQVNPRHAPTFQLLGDLARWRGEWELALANYEHASSLAPTLEGVQTAIQETREQWRLARLAAMPLRIDACTVGMESFADNQGFRWLSTSATRVWRPSWGTVELAVRQDQPSGMLAQPERESLTGYGITGEVQLPLTGGSSLSLLLGASDYSQAGAFATWGVGMEVADLGGVRLDARYTHQPAVRRTATLASLQAGTISDVVSISASREGERTSVWAQAQAERLHSDLGTTHRYSGNVSLSRRLGSNWSVSAGLDALSTTGDRPDLSGAGPLYWAPELYVSPSVTLAYETSLSEHWFLGGSVSPGYAWIREPQGPAQRFSSNEAAMLGLGVDLRYRRERWSVEAGLDWSGPLDASGYRATSLQVQGSYFLDGR